MKNQIVTTKEDSHFVGKTIHIEDTWMNVTGKSWMHSDGNPAALNYAIRSGVSGLPMDGNVYYGKINGLGHLIHESEIEIPEVS